MMVDINRNVNIILKNISTILEDTAIILQFFGFIAWI